ncbi:MAG: hypothetical protein MZW92_40385 [Comamonadaceae bacterium]|nr:hypothetical protein [Comamonadaceae bacterium]
MLGLSRRVADVAARHPDGPGMLVKVVAGPYEQWPIPWHLRGMPHVGYWATAAEAGPCRRCRGGYRCRGPGGRDWRRARGSLRTGVLRAPAGRDSDACSSNARRGTASSPHARARASLGLSAGSDLHARTHRTRGTAGGDPCDHGGDVRRPVRRWRFHPDESHWIGLSAPVRGVLHRPGIRTRSGRTREDRPPSRRR